MTLMSILINYGFLVFGLTDYTGAKFSAHYGAITAGPPSDDEEKEACRRLGRRLSEWVGSLIEGKQEAHPLNQTYDRFKDKG